MDELTAEEIAELAKETGPYYGTGVEEAGAAQHLRRTYRHLTADRRR